MYHRTVPHKQNQPETKLNANDLPQPQYTLRQAESVKEREKEPVKPALKRIGQKQRENTTRKSVHWTANISRFLDVDRYQRRFIRQCRPRQIMTIPFTVAFEIGGEQYTVRFEPLAPTSGLVNNFENELERNVPDSHKPLLRLAMSRGYEVLFHRLLRTSRTVVDDHDPSLKEASFNCFLNAVFKEANVTIAWV
jgi:hypothetical protein